MAQRQSPLAIVFLAFRVVRRIGLAQVAIFIGFLGARATSLVVVGLMVAAIGTLLFVVAALQWWRYTFSVVEGELLVRRGVLSQQRLTIPLERVQSVSIGEKLMHRPFSLVEVSVDTAGADAAEFTIDAIPKSTALALQQMVTDNKPAAVAEPEEGASTVIVHHGLSRLVRVGLTQAPFAGLILIGPLFSIGESFYENLPFELPNVDPERFGVLEFLVLATAALVIAVLLNVVRVLLADWNLTVKNTPAGVRRSAGLFSTTTLVSTVPRIQRFAVRQRLLERPFGFHTATLATIGSNSISVHGCDERQVAIMRALAMGDAGPVEPLDRPVSKKIVFLRTRNTAIVTSLVALVLSTSLGWWTLVAVLPVIYIWLATRRQARLRRWGLTHEAVSDRRQFMQWRRQDVLLRKVNGTHIRQTLFERRRGLATVRLATAAGGVSIGMISLEDAKALRDRALFVAETDQQSWM